MTVTDLELIGNDAVFLAAGYALLAAAGLARLRPGDVRLIGLAYFAGWALMGVLLSLLVLAGVPLEPLTTVLAAAGAVAVCAAVRWRLPNAVPARASEPRSISGLVATAIGAAVIAITALAALITALSSDWNPDFDLLSAWLPRAEIVYYLHHLDPAQWSSFIDPWYPPLVPVIYGTTFQFVQGFHPSVLPVQQVVLGISFVLAALALLDRFVPRWISFPSLALLMVTPWFWWRMQLLLPDATLSYLLAAAALVIVIWLYEPNAAWLALGVVFLAAATLAKLEGLIFAGLLAVVMIVAAFVLHRRRALPALVLLLGPAATLPWRLWLDTHAVAVTNPDFNGPQLLDPGFLAGRAGDFAHVIGLILAGPWRPAYRTTEVILVVGVLVLGCTIRRIPVIALATVGWLGLITLALAATYATSRLDPTSYFAVSGSRVGGTVVVAAATLAPLLLGLALRVQRGADRPP